MHVTMLEKTWWIPILLDDTLIMFRSRPRLAVSYGVTMPLLTEDDELKCHISTKIWKNSTQRQKTRRGDLQMYFMNKLIYKLYNIITKRSYSMVNHDGR